MKVLISAGIRTQDVINRLKETYDCTGEELIAVPYIEDIEQIFSFGEYFDKAIIVEKSINHNDEDKNIDSMIQKVGKFCQRSLNRDKNEQIVFVTSKKVAEQIYYETYMLGDNSAIVLAEDKYSLKLFAGLLVKDIKALPESILYKQEVETVEEEDTNEIELPKEENNIDYDKVKSFDSEDFGSEIETDSKVDDIVEDNNDFEEVEIENNTDFEEETNNSLEETEDIETKGNNELEMDDDFFDKLDSELDNMSFDEEVDKDSTEVEEVNIDDLFVNYDSDTDMSISKGSIENNENEEETEEVEEETEEVEEFNTDENNFSTEVDSNNEIEVDFTEEESELITNEESDSNNEELDELESFSSSDDEEDDTEYEASYAIYEEKNDKIEDVNNNNSIDINNSLFEYEQSDDNDDNLEVDKNNIELSNEELNKILSIFANRGTSIAFTGVSGMGTSTIAFNVANLLANMGYRVLLVDMDTVNKAQSYISLDSYSSSCNSNSALIKAINTSKHSLADVAILKANLHLLTMNMADDANTPSKILHEKNLISFMTLTRNKYQFIVYDIPFDYATTTLQQVMFNVDYLAQVVDASTWGIGKTMLAMCNIEDVESADAMFAKTKFILNRVKDINKFFGKKIKKPKDILTTMDNMQDELMKKRQDYRFSEIPICGYIPYNENYSKAWFNKVQISDTEDGKNIFMNLINNIIK